jgi:hypothetical protein
VYRSSPVRIALLLAIAIGAGCGEEELPAPIALGGELRVSADSTAVLMGSNVLFDGNRPGVGAGDTPVRFARVAISPDSSHIAFATAAGRLGVWSRLAQSAQTVVTPGDGRLDTLAWAPAGPFLAYQGVDEDGRVYTEIYSARSGRTAPHPVARWLNHHGQSVVMSEWVDHQRLRLQVAPDRDAQEGLDYLWDPVNAMFAVETHLEPLAASAPPGATLERGGVFSVDVLGDATPESVALYRSAEGAPSALVLEQRADGYRVRSTEPLLDLDVLGFDAWENVSGGASLRVVSELGGRPVLLLTFPSSRPPLSAIGLFGVSSHGQLAPIEVVTRDGTQPAFFFDGQTAIGSNEMGLLDLDGDGGFEVVVATGRVEGRAPDQRMAWRASTFRWADGRLVPAPELESVALERIERLIAGRPEDD